MPHKKKLLPISELDRRELLKLYEIIVNEQHSFVNVHEIRISFYSGLVTLLIGGIAYTWLSADKFPQFLGISAGIIFLFVVATIAPRAVLGPYELAMDRIATRSKIEDALGLTSPRKKQINGSRPKWWKEEPFIGPAHKETWGEHPSSSKWVAARSGGRYFKTIKVLFITVQYVSIFMLLGLGMQIATSLNWI